MGELLLIPDDVPASRVLDQWPPELHEIALAACAHYRVGLDPGLKLKHIRGLVVLLARRYTRASLPIIGAALGCSASNAASMGTKMSGKLEIIEQLRDDHDVIERRIAELVIARSGGWHV
ncbi:hypothetical protein ACKWRH_23730 [Bradyrhizobium sp. Pa8]|uniref:hypothetical protein n=1 Tax=Bradyrhizobium sp. Pa8 TaxID=3386552 RepID=UPI00403F4687